MKKIFLFYCFFLLGNIYLRADDIIIFRDANIVQTKISQITDEKVRFYDKEDQEKEIFPGEIYMIGIESQGNIYFNEEGKRWSGETNKPDYTKHDIVYLKEGAEIPFESIRITDKEISFKVKDLRKWKGIKGLLGLDKNNIITRPKEEIFLIRYKSGLIDIVTPFNHKTQDEKPEDQEPTITTLFYELQPGDTLENVAEKYEVTVEEIAEWNDLKKVRGKYVASPGTQLLITTAKNIR